MPRKHDSSSEEDVRPVRSRNKAKVSKQKDSSDDDSSVDSKGNIRNLIDYDYEEDSANTDSDSTYTVSSSSEEVKPRRVLPKRKAAIKARRRIRRASVSSSSDEDTEMSDEPKPIKKQIKKRRLRKMSEIESEQEMDEESSEEEKVSKKKSKGRKKQISDSESESLHSSEDDSDDSSDEDASERSLGNIIGLRLGGFGLPDPNKPRKHKMKDQPQIVKRFVKLVQKETAPDEQSTIDNDITYFKTLPEERQNLIIQKMERKFSMDEEAPMKFKLLEKQVPQQVEKVAMGKFNALNNLDPGTGEYYKTYHWIEGYSNIPFGVYKDLPVKLDDGPAACAAFVGKVRENMDSAIYGHDEAKLQILQFVSSWIANPKGAGNVLSIYGPMGVGKTTLVKEGVAKALDRPFSFISLGGATDASYLDGHSYTYEGSTWGRIADILMQSKCMNPIIYFDELDKISETPKGEEIMNLLIHITDGSQNDKFQDKYFSGIDLDLSRCLFIFSHNHHERVNPILRDRMYNIKVEGFDLKEKLVIAETHLLPQALKDLGLNEKIAFAKDVVQYIVENFTGEEKGVRELKRCIQTVMSKLNLLRFYNDPKLVPFAIPNFSLPFTLKKEHIDLLLKKRESRELDPSISHLYT